MATGTWIAQELRQRGIPFAELHHPDAFTAQGVAQHEHISGHLVAKVVVVIADGQPAELILPASRRVSLERVGQVLDARDVRLAREDEIEVQFPDCELGAMPAWRHWAGVEVLMDQMLETEGDIVLQAGTHRDAVRMKFADWFAVVQPRVARFSEPASDRPAHPV
jgi:Ala-tRNA(Pro) deacylase